MSPRRPFVFSFLLFALVSSAGAMAAAAGKLPEKESAESPLASLKQGDPAAKVEKVLGKPVETRPMEAPDGKAEVWVYVKELSRRVDQVRAAAPDSVTMVPTAGGMLRQTAPGAVQLHQVHYVREEVVEVLLFNGHYVVHKVSRQERKL